MLALLLVQCVSESSADLVPPFQQDEDGAVGYWKFGGTAMPQEQSILLCPAVQFRRGCAWTTVEFPDDVWSVKFTFDITNSEFSGCGGGIGIFFIKALGVEGNLHGGPNQFKGAAVLLTVSESGTENTRRVEIATIQSFGNIAFSLPVKANATLNVRDGQTLEIRVRVAEGVLSVLGAVGGERERTLTVMPLNVDISQNYLGVTAQTGQHVNSFELRAVEWDVETGPAKSASFQKGSGRYQPSHFTSLRSPKFNVTVDEMGKKLEVPDSEAQADTLMQVIDELAAAMTDVASFSDVNDFVKTTLGPYTLKWGRRTMKIVDQVSRVRNLMESTLNYTNTLIRDMHKAIEGTGFALFAKIEDLEIAMVEELSSDQSSPNRVVMAADPVEFDYVMTMLYLGLFETVLVVTFFMLQRTAKFKEKFFN